MKSKIRPMTHQDIEVVQKLAVELGYPDSLEVVQKRFQELVVLPFHRLLVLDDRGIKGWIHLERTFSMIAPVRVQIKALVVSEMERGKGFGKALLNEATAWGKDSGVGTIYLSANIIRDKSHAFYLKNGFSKKKTSHFFEMKI